MFESTFYDLLAKNLPYRGDSTIVIDGKTNVTYLQLNCQVDVLASWLIEQGVRRGDRVGIHLHKSTEEIVAMFAASRIGAVFVNINYQWSKHQLDYVLKDCGISVLICDVRPALQLATRDWPDTLSAVVVKGKTPNHSKMTSWPKAAARIPLPNPVGLDVDLAALLYTSGSTGQPKGVMLSHRNILASARSAATHLENNENDRLLSLLPFSFDYGLSQLTTMCLVGGSIILQKVMMPAEVVKTLVSHEITGFSAVPPAWIPIANFLRDNPCDLPSLRYVTNSGGKLPGPTLKDLPNIFPNAKIYLMYGLTEAFRSTYLPPHLYQSKMGAIGQSLPNAETYIINENGIVTCNGQGELVHRGSMVSLGYWHKPKATAAKIRPCPQLQHLIGNESVCYSGDIIRVDEDGYYWFVNRSDTMIKSSGFRISPTEVEDLVYESKLVEHAVAFGVPHELNGQEVHIAVNLYNKAESETDTLMKYCRQNMPHYMVPGKIHCWKQPMPRTGSGKLSRPDIINKCIADANQTKSNT